MRIAFDASPGFDSNWLSRRTLNADLRHYTRIGSNGVLALRLKTQKSWGQHPDLFYFGGNSEMRGYDYLEFTGHHGFFANAELRYPLIEAMLTPMGVVGGLRGVFFVNMGGAGITASDITLNAGRFGSSACTSCLTAAASCLGLPLLRTCSAIAGCGFCK